MGFNRIEIIKRNSLRKAKLQQSTKELMFTIFGDCKRIPLIYIKERNENINAEYYARLFNTLPKEIKEKRSKILSHGAQFLHEKIPVNSAIVDK